MTLHRAATLALLALTLAAPLAAQQASAPASQLTGSLRGEVHYADGSPVSAADITLTPASGPAVRVTTGPDGIYAFANIPAGPFTLTAAANALQPDTLTGAIPPAAEFQPEPLTLRLATTVISINAISAEQAAELEVQSEEHQRVLGAIPNFLVSYDTSPVPLSSSQKYRLTLRTLLDPATFAAPLFVATGGEITRSYPGFGHGAPGYARRYAAAYGDTATNVLLTDAILPSLLHQDPRYFYKGTGSTASRIGWILKQAVAQRGDNGRWQPAFSNTLGDMGSALISTTYYPARTTGWATLTTENFGLAILSQGIGNLLQEFVFGRFTPHQSN